MKVACIDHTASDRVKLQHLLEQAYDECRNSIGHLPLAIAVPKTKEEVIINHPPDVIAIGPGFSIEEALRTCHEIKQQHPTTPVVSFLEPSLYTLRALRRFEKVCDEVFSIEDRPIRLIHRISLLAKASSPPRNGRLVVVTGAKGGVGTTSVVSALAHSAEALDRKAVVLDLSRSGALIQYMASQRWQSADFASALVEKIWPDKSLVEHCLTTAPNGVNLLLPPAGGHEVREQWLHDIHSFETTLAILDQLRETYDVVLVDTAGTEGILPFALNARADIRLLVSSNDPAAVHLLHIKLEELIATPGDGRVHILLNLTNERGLNRGDIADFLVMQNYPDSMILEPVPFDVKGRNWIGTGNTFYTESCSAVQAIFDRALKSILLTQEQLELERKKNGSVLSSFWKFSIKTRRRKKKIPAAIKALPFEASDENNTQHESKVAVPHSDKDILRNKDILRDKEGLRKGEILQNEEILRPADGNSFLYQAPVFQAGISSEAERASLSLEQILFLALAVLLMTTALPVFVEQVENYLVRFVETTIEQGDSYDFQGQNI